ncbi:MAG: exodeoxyribonuclease VII large subunit [Clostridia bacterium]|nr:exodeoxyribonuclease VII large subunit [Clostridia bacterium]
MAYEARNAALTVTQLNNYVKTLFDTDDVLSAVSVCGEISNFKNHYSTGHLYFSLKDNESLIRCVMFASSAAKLKFAPENGMTVTLYGRVSVYPRDGAYQIYVSNMIPDGIGDQYIAFELLKKKLEAEGLFDQSRKKPLPKFPSTVGVVTSSTGAAIRDIMNVLSRRYPVASVLIYPALVQGVSAAKSVADGVRFFNDPKNFREIPAPDVIIIGRGGGSGEDLSAFNDEGLARAVAASDIPIISAVGHETDFTITDFVSDLRAPTPSAAAELAVPDRAELLRKLANVTARCTSIMSGRIEHFEKQLDTLASARVLRSPQTLLDIRLDTVSRFAEKLDNGYEKAIEASSAKLARTASKLDAMSPLKVISRGYAVVRGDGGVVSSVAELTVGQEADITLSDGEARATITQITKKQTEIE